MSVVAHYFMSALSFLFSNMLAAQSFDSNQRMSTKMFTASGEKLLVAPKHLLIPNAEARRRRHIPGTESFPASRRQSHLNEEEDSLPEPELSPEEIDLLERSAVEAAPVVRVLPPAILSRDNMELQGTDRTCPTGWVPFGNMCYYFYPAAYKNTWETCSSLCKETPGAVALNPLPGLSFPVSPFLSAVCHFPLTVLLTSK